MFLFSSRTTLFTIFLRSTITYRYPQRLEDIQKDIVGQNLSNLTRQNLEDFFLRNIKNDCLPEG